MTQLVIEPPNGRHPLKSPKLWVDLKMIPLMGSPHLTKWVRTRCRKRIDGIRYPSRDPTAVTPAPSEGNICYECEWLNQSGSDKSFTSTIDYTRVNPARSSPWLTGMYTSNRKYMNPGTNKGGRYNITPSSSRACWQQTQHNQA